MEDKNKKAKMLKAMGDKRFDVEAYLASEDGKDHAELMGTCMQKGEGTPEDMEYWRACGNGLKKELHGDPADVHTKWASYLPLAAVREMEQSTGRKPMELRNWRQGRNVLSLLRKMKMKRRFWSC